MTSFIVWDPEYYRKRASKWVFKSAPDSCIIFVFLHVCIQTINNSVIGAGKEVSRNGL